MKNSRVNIKRGQKYFDDTYIPSMVSLYLDVAVRTFSESKCINGDQLRTNCIKDQLVSENQLESKDPFIFFEAGIN